MANRRNRLDAMPMARSMVESIGREIAMMRSDLGLSVRAAARLAGVSPETQLRIERGDPCVEAVTMCRVAAALGLKIWGRAFPSAAPTLRDTGQLRIAEYLRTQAHPATKIELEVPLGNLVSADLVSYGATEIAHFEIERMPGSFETTYRRAADKRVTLADQHQRPVRLILAVEDTRRNRQTLRPHAELIASVLPASSRHILRAHRTGEPIGRDGLLWVRPPKVR